MICQFKIYYETLDRIQSDLSDLEKRQLFWIKFDEIVVVLQPKEKQNRWANLNPVLLE